MSNLVSIIVPVYNAEKYLRTCIGSIINQTYKKLEIILINDGSTDGSKVICEEFKSKDDRIIFIDKVNEGLSVARQTGINKLNGDYFCTVDSDDYIEENFIEKMLDTIVKDDSDICVCGISTFDLEHKKVSGFSRDIESPFQIDKELLSSSYKSLTELYYMSDSWNKIYKTSFIKKSDIVFSLDKKYNGTDLLFNHLLMLHLPKISVINHPLYNYRIVENSRVRRKNKQLQQGFFIILKEIIIENDKLGYSNLLDTQVANLHLSFQKYAAQDLIASENDYTEIMKKLYDYLYENEKYLSENSIVLNQLIWRKNLTLSDTIFNYCLSLRKREILYLFLKTRLILLNYKILYKRFLNK